MHRLQLHYSLTRQAQSAGVDNPMIALLEAVRAQGSISAAAKALGMSYRHVWGELKRWEQELGDDLVVWEKGQAARLTEFGAKLLWAERQAQARLAPQIEALRAGLEQSFAAAFDPHAHVATLFASHDDALPLLREHALAATPGPIHLDIRFCGSLDALRALNEGRCVLAGFHAQEQAPPGSATQQRYQPLLEPGLHKIIGFARRTQGLMVAQGNPLGIRSLRDVVEYKARFVNRAMGSGTRLLLDELLQANRLQANDLVVHERVEPSHAAVALAVSSGTADAGLGVESAARRAGVGFVPLLQERYYLACLKSALEDPAVQALRTLIAQAPWLQAVATVPGYVADHPGEVLSLKQALPWWTFDRQKRHRVRPRRT